MECGRPVIYIYLPTGDYLETEESTTRKQNNLSVNALGKHSRSMENSSDEDARLFTNTVN
jgi:hypothetical protein